MQRKDPNVLASTVSENPGKTRYESRLPLSSWTEQHLRTVRFVKDASHQVTQEGMLTRIGLLKSGNLMN